MSDVETKEHLPKNGPEASTGQNNGIAGKIAALTTVILAIGGLIDGVVIVATKVSLTCNLPIYFPWCPASKTEDQPPPAIPAPPAIPPVANSKNDTPPPFTAPSPAPLLSPQSNWTHNNSGMSITAQGDSVTIYYAKPRQGMMDQGVQSGTVLFYGRLVGTRLSGISYVFDRRCGKIPYPDNGEVLNGGRQVVLDGQRVPTQLGPDCQVLGYRVDPSQFYRID